jgi:hypothetical protein
MFLIRYYVPAVGYVVTSLVPRPTSVDYPEARLFKMKQSKDGAAIIQRPLRDPRPRKWIWEKYRPTISVYETQWQLLKSLEVQTRWELGLADTRVQIWENDSGEGGFHGVLNILPPDLEFYTNLRWTWVQFIQVDRHIRPGGGPVTYDSSTIEFVIDDDDYGRPINIDPGTVGSSSSSQYFGPGYFGNSFFGPNYFG